MRSARNSSAVSVSSGQRAQALSDGKQKLGCKTLRHSAAAARLPTVKWGIGFLCAPSLYDPFDILAAVRESVRSVCGSALLRYFSRSRVGALSENCDSFFRLFSSLFLYYIHGERVSATNVWTFISFRKQWVRDDIIFIRELKRFGVLYWSSQWDSL